MKALCGNKLQVTPLLHMQSKCPSQLLEMERSEKLSCELIKNFLTPMKFEEYDQCFKLLRIVISCTPYK